jgi:hypothetical protein
MDNSGRIANTILMTCVVWIVSVNLTYSQKRFSTQAAEIKFTSNAELELINAATDKVQGLVDPQTNQFAFSVDIKTFQGFNSELQREHFNEKYMESERFPKGKFSGKIIEEIDFTQNGNYDVRAKGDLEIHGLKQTRLIKGKLNIKDGTLKIEANFVVPLNDHNITIPTIVRQKIATEIEVNFNASMLLQ